MPSIFSQIVAGDIPCHKVAETDEFLAFLDIMPLAEGHTLVIPKQEVDRIWDLDPKLLGRLHQFSQMCVCQPSLLARKSLLKCSICPSTKRQ